MPKVKKKQPQQIIVRKKYNTGSSNKYFGIIPKDTLSLALAAGGFTLAGIVFWKVFFSNGRQEEQKPSDQNQNQQAQQGLSSFQTNDQSSSLQQSPFAIPNQNLSPEEVKTMIKRGGPVRVQQGSIGADIAQSVATLSNQQTQPIFSDIPPSISTHPQPEQLVNQPKPEVKTKEQVMQMQKNVRKPATIPSYGDSYYNAVSNFPSGFFLKNPAPQEKSR